MLDFENTLSFQGELRYQVERELRRVGIGSWAAECLVHRTLGDQDGHAVLELLANVPDGAFGPWGVQLDENGDPR